MASWAAGGRAVTDSVGSTLVLGSAACVGSALRGQWGFAFVLAFLVGALWLWEVAEPS